ncbi:MAG: hypothetical protein KJ011_02020 [Burkholderiaceae bacterium]|nr:hypothetical protein [Burkholderiaceae bacterium]
MVFDRQDAAWRDAVLPAGLPCIDVAAAVRSRCSPDAAALASLVAARAGADVAVPPMQA